MYEILSNFFQKKKIDCFAALPLDACRIKRPYLLERTGITAGSVIMVAVPYYTEACDGQRNLSAYAVGEDYHAFFRTLLDEAVSLLSASFPSYRYAAFADHSPIDEVDAAARASLGVIGKNGLLITKKYASYVFLGEVITDAVIPAVAREPLPCPGCGACLAACPAKGEECLSALTQKKGSLTEEERTRIRIGASVWGCDRCQEVCPLSLRARREGTLYSPIPYFAEHALPVLTKELLDQMDDTDFSRRAYAWRGRAVIARNLELLEEGDEPC